MHTQATEQATYCAGFVLPVRPQLRHADGEVEIWGLFSRHLRISDEKSNRG